MAHLVDKPRITITTELDLVEGYAYSSATRDHIVLAPVEMNRTAGPNCPA